MSLIHLALSILLILVNLAALTLITARWLPPGLAKASGLLALTLALFALEHQVGLGSLRGVWPVMTCFSVYLLWRGRARVTQRDFWVGEATFAGVFAYAMTWRFFTPDVGASTEQHANLYFIANYLPGDRLPPPDLWLAGPYRFDFYYGFQHYVAALLGRFLDLSPGLTMNLAQPLVLAFIGSLGAFAVAQFVKPRWTQALLVCALVAGGNGLTPLLHSFLNLPAETAAQHVEKARTQIWAATRFSGAYEDRLNTSEGIEFFKGDLLNDLSLSKMDLPFETISYYSLVGDYHPPLGSFALLVLSLALMAWLIMGAAGAPSPRSRNVATAMVAATPVLCIVTNVWALPLQALLALCFALAGLLHRRSGQPPFAWRAFLIGGLITLLMCYPFLSTFSPQAFAPEVRPVPEEAATRLSVWIALHWPAVLLALMALVVGLRLPWLWWLAGLLVVVLAFSELFYLADGSGGPYLRFNTTLKWWSWTLPLALIGLAAPLFAFGGKVVKAAVIVAAAALLTNLVNVGRYLWFVDSPHLGRLAGDGWLRADRAHGDLLSWLRLAPRGLVLERVQGGAYSSTGALSIYAGKPMVLGWPAHQAQWRREQTDIWPLHDQINQFYAGASTDALAWLRQRRVQYVLWTRWDETKMLGGSLRIDAQIGTLYRFRAFEVQGSSRVGVWEYQGVPNLTQMPTGSPLTRPNSFQP